MQFKGHLLKKIVVRTPGPSSVAILSILKINPFDDVDAILHHFIQFNQIIEN